MPDAHVESVICQSVVNGDIEIRDVLVVPLRIGDDDALVVQGVGAARGHQNPDNYN